MAGDLFSHSAESRLATVAPLAQRLRPGTIDEFVGQSGVVGEGSALRRAIASDCVPSMIFFGPPGSGKTTLARIVAHTTKSHFEELSAVQVGVADVRRVLAEARDRLGANEQRTILFLDEIHRFNKAQQDALLPAVESGLLTLIGATTENPYFEVNSALLSRTQVYELEPLTREELAVIVRRGAAHLGAEIDDDLVDLIAAKAAGDGRNALSILELAWWSARSEDVSLAERHVEDAARKRPVVYDKTGDAHYDFTSAFIKAIRGSDPDAALYYLAAMLEGGEDPRFIARRLVVHASEDVGMADSQALLVAVAAAHAVEHVGLPEARINLAHATIYLARAPKSNSVIRAIGAAQEDAISADPVPKHLRDASYPGAKRLGHGKGYVYPHDRPGHWADQEYRPARYEGTRYYTPSGMGEDTDDWAPGEGPSRPDAGTR